MQMSSRKKPSTTRSRSSRTKRKFASPASTTKALVNKADHVRRQALKAVPKVRAPGKTSAKNEKPSTNGTASSTDALSTAATENLRPAIAVPTHVLAFWSPMAAFLRQQTLLTSTALHVVQSQRLWAQTFSRSA
jgi:hypothetical protein